MKVKFPSIRNEILECLLALAETSVQKIRGKSPQKYFEVISVTEISAVFFDDYEKIIEIYPPSWKNRFWINFTDLFQLRKTIIDIDDIRHVPNRMIGRVFKDKNEMNYALKTIILFDKVARDVIYSHPFSDISDEEYFTSPEWIHVIEAAQQTLTVWKH